MTFVIFENFRATKRPGCDKAHVAVEWLWSSYGWGRWDGMSCAENAAINILINQYVVNPRNLSCMMYTKNNGWVLEKGISFEIYDICILGIYMLNFKGWKICINCLYTGMRKNPYRRLGSILGPKKMGKHIPIPWWHWWHAGWWEAWDPW